ncbi:glycosyltransferase family 4 protein [Halovenus rubra]|uniref:Glycosyltransferase family 4 protein n=2 Tax=Halovenus rubra TaxID=869890 RepID=A0ACC7DXC7_9EURY
MEENHSVLVISNVGPHADKIQKHFEPLKEITGQVTIARVDPAVPLDGISYIRPPPVGPKILQAFLLFFYTLKHCFVNKTDEIVTVSLLPSGIYGLVLGTMFNKPTHHWIIGSDINRYSKKYPRVTFFLLSRFDTVLVMGTKHKEYLVKNGIQAEKVKVMPGSIDIDKYQPKDDSKHYDFIWVGQMKPIKRPLLFVEALDILHKRGYEFNAVMPGSGPLEPEVKDRIQTGSLSSFVKLPGWVEPNALVEYYHKSDIFVMTSEKDAFGFPLVEAMATGLIGIAPHREDPSKGNTVDIIDDMQSGIILSEMTAENLADTFEVLLNDTELRERLSQNAPDVREKFSRSQVSDEWKDVFTQLDEEEIPSANSRG